MLELILFLLGLAVLAVGFALYVNRTDHPVKPQDKMQPHSHSSQR